LATGALRLTGIEEWLSSRDRRSSPLQGAEVSDMKIDGQVMTLDVVNSALRDSVFDDVRMPNVRINNANLSALSLVNTNVSGAKFDDVNLSGAHFHNVSLANVKIEESCVDGMTINDILVTDLLMAYEAAKAARGN
jgi:uncharacterized protein YjbI with pentapeptide repeats